MSVEAVTRHFAAYQRTAAVKSAVELDVFTAIAEGVDKIGDLAAAFSWRSRAMRRRPARRLSRNSSHG